MCLLAVSAQQCTMPAISAHDLRFNRRRFSQTRMASVLAGEGGRHGHPPGQPGGPAAHHQLCALHPLLCRAEAHWRAVPRALQGLPCSFSRLSPLPPLVVLQLDQFPSSYSTSQGTWGHLQYGHTLFHFERHLADTAPAASRPPQIMHVCHLLAFPVLRRPPERTCTRSRTWKPP